MFPNKEIILFLDFSYPNLDLPSLWSKFMSKFGIYQDFGQNSCPNLEFTESLVKIVISLITYSIKFCAAIYFFFRNCYEVSFFKVSASFFMIVLMFFFRNVINYSFFFSLYRSLLEGMDSPR